MMPNSPIAVIIDADEQILSVEVSDPDAFQLTVADMADCLFIRSTRPNAEAIVNLKTDRRTYSLTVRSAVGVPPYYMVYLSNAPASPALPHYASATPRSPAPQSTMETGRYQLSGNRELRPSAIHDDGQRTYMQWPSDQALPAVFALDRLGREEMVNGFMRDDWFTIDRIHDHLVFRIDKAKAEARRLPQEVGTK
ncbi:TrbG/VirB9 family P-type conjugative transfer protein [Sphingobium yanoikuyae]